MTINYNEPITFGRTGSGAVLNSIGIDFAEDPHQSWTCLPVAEVDIQLPFARQDIVIQIDASPFLVPGVVAAQKVFIFLGGLFVGYYTLTGHATRTFPVSRSVVSGRAARLCLVLPTAVSPSELGLSEDLRELGIYLRSIVFKTVP